MYLRPWTRILSLLLCPRLVYVDAVLGDAIDTNVYDSHLSDQEVFAGLCPDYTSYARHKQYFARIIDVLHSC